MQNRFKNRSTKTNPKQRAKKTPKMTSKWTQKASQKFPENPGNRPRGAQGRPRRPLGSPKDPQGTQQTPNDSQKTPRDALRIHKGLRKATKRHLTDTPKEPKLKIENRCNRHRDSDSIDATLKQHCVDNELGPAECAERLNKKITRAASPSQAEVLFFESRALIFWILLQLILLDSTQERKSCFGSETKLIYPVPA